MVPNGLNVSVVMAAVLNLIRQGNGVLNTQH